MGESRFGVLRGSLSLRWLLCVFFPSAAGFVCVCVCVYVCVVRLLPQHDSKCVPISSVPISSDMYASLSALCAWPFVSFQCPLAVLKSSSGYSAFRNRCKGKRLVRAANIGLVIKDAARIQRAAVKAQTERERDASHPLQTEGAGGRR